ncbi:MAG: UDP-N-acetylmuramoyl-L-alanyl-D-glutamate--2,6-diaminopimelate ligase [Candidatus Dormibacteraeota bacterium]|nr:UDP-N-acetylmuramoyl-L-alanyl-D-glutamate--2,6-diaminopimelate ligase [Candidatus Dormibacteraeota bacterium]MBV9524361.1 UDP-N-acetylmuramoyl-L-alanyl-D-glutamate--2,6-diaminopimelate ligase [Candidatus Dormibacteraeota bacterium]
MRLSTLLAAAGIDAATSSDPEITRIDYDSRSCEPGSLFVAVRGFHADGHDFAAGAVERGAVAVVAGHGMAQVRAALVVVPDTRVALSALAAAWHGFPSRDMCVAGITGTDGKTTTATMLWAAWAASGLAAGSLTTVDWRSRGTVTANKSRQTTLEAPELQEHLARLRADGVTHAAVETSSHALELHRADHVAYRAGVYTRITSEHLELHGSREAYLRAKARLLELVGPRPDGVAVLDPEDDFAYPLLSRIPVASRLTYTTSPDAPADVRAERLDQGPRGLRVAAATPWGRAEFSLRLAGRFNAANALAALTAACATGAGLDGAVRGLEGLERVDGRMERVEAGQPFTVVIDYAHTAEALHQALTELRPATSGRLWVVFGSAGERDVAKRPAMGAVAARLADVSVITDEDPRLEDRLRILEDIAAGATEAGGRRGEDVVVVPDRSEAIDFAVAHAAEGDTVLLAGKGHESTLISGATAQPWDERAVAEDAIRRRLAGA